MLDRLRAPNKRVEVVAEDKLVLLHDWWPPYILDGLIKTVRQMPSRKQSQIMPGWHVPEGSVRAQSRAQAGCHHLPLLNPNELIFKIYQEGAGSESFDWHPDPEKYLGNWIALGYLTGKSTLLVDFGDGTFADVETEPNMVAVVQPELYHMATEPYGDERFFMFAGANRELTPELYSPLAVADK